MASPQIGPFDVDAVEVCSAISPGAFRMANILLPVDFSEPCARAVRHASMLGRCFGSEVTVLHVQAVVLDFEGTRNSGLKERLESFERTTLEGLGVRRLLLEATISHARYSNWNVALALMRYLCRLMEPALFASLISARLRRTSCNEPAVQSGRASIWRGPYISTARRFGKSC